MAALTHHKRQITRTTFGYCYAGTMADTVNNKGKYTRFSVYATTRGPTLLNTKGEDRYSILLNREEAERIIAELRDGLEQTVPQPHAINFRDTP